METLEKLNGIVIQVPKGKDAEVYQDLIMKYIDFISCLGIGEENAIPVNELSNSLGFLYKHAKDLKRKALDDGVLICTSEKGYYLPSSDADIEKMYKFFRGRAQREMKSAKPFGDYLKGRNHKNFCIISFDDLEKNWMNNPKEKVIDSCFRQKS